MIALERYGDAAPIRLLERAWKAAKPGERIPYYRGSLLLDFHNSTIAIAAMRDARDFARALYQDGEADLVNEHHGAGDQTYCMVKRAKSAGQRKGLWHKGGFALMLMIAGAQAAPPPGVSSTGPIADWVHRWRDTTGFPCCGLDTDCRPTVIRESDTSPSGFEAWIDKERFGPSAPDDWRPVPISGFSATSEENPTGSGWACWYRGQVVCAAHGRGF
jgi:hypothetical protein